MTYTYNYLDCNDIQASLTKLKDKTVFLGFDAFIDFPVSPIKQGNAIKPEAFFDTIGELGSYLNEHDGSNCSIELSDSLPRIGGNMANTANAISLLGIRTFCVGTFGYPVCDPIFSSMSELCELISVEAPGKSIVLEFKNGKVILGMNQGVNILNWDIVKKRAGLDKILKFVDSSELLFMLNWSELPNSTNIFRGMSLEIFSKITDDKLLFIDLSDCARRDASELSEIMEIIKTIPKNFRTILSMNRNEENIICAALGVNTTARKERGRELIELLHLDTVLFHSRELNAFVTRDDYAELVPDLCIYPKINVGAGDNFNAAAALGIWLGLNAEDCIGFAAEAARYYIENGKSFRF